MKATLLTPLFLTLLPFLASCDGDVKASDVVASGKDALGKIEDLDVSKLSVDGMKAKVGELTAALSKSFETIKDEASAIDVEKSVEPMIDSLRTLKDSLGAQMPSMDSLKATVDQLKMKFAGNESVMKVLQPLLDKLQQLLR